MWLDSSGITQARSGSAGSSPMTYPKSLGRSEVISTQLSPPSSLLGSTIQIDFEAGEPKQLTGTDAIGVFLEPAEEGDSG